MPGILAQTIAAACQIVIFQRAVESFLESQGVKDLDVVEIFTVFKSVARAAENHGLRSETFDYVNAEHADITTAKGFHQAVQLVLPLKPHGLLVLAPVCSSFGFAPCSSTKRCKDDFACDVKNANVQKSNFMARISFFLFVLAWALDMEVIFENPVGSMIFSFLQQEIKSLREIGKVPQFICTTSPLSKNDTSSCAVQPG